MLIPSSAAVPEDHSQPAAASSSLCAAVPSQKVAFHPSLPLTECPKKPSGCSQLSRAPGAAELFLQTLWPPGAQQTDGLWSGLWLSWPHSACHQASHNAPRVQPSIPDGMQRMQITEHAAISPPTSNLQHPLGDKERAPLLLTSHAGSTSTQYEKGGRRARSTGLWQLSNAVPRSDLEAPLSLKEAIIEKVTL